MDIVGVGVGVKSMPMPMPTPTMPMPMPNLDVVKYLMESPAAAGNGHEEVVMMKKWSFGSGHLEVVIWKWLDI
jgi:hypothetical protein